MNQTNVTFLIKYKESDFDSEFLSIPIGTIFAWHGPIELSKLDAWRVFTVEDLLLKEEKKETKKMENKNLEKAEASTIETILLQITSALDTTSKIITKIEDKIKPVLSNRKEIQPEYEANKEGESSPHAMYLLDICYRINRLNDQLNSITHRIEL